MSGPKISIYSLTGRAKEIVLGQIRCEQQSIACYLQLKRLVRELQSFPERIEKQMQCVQLLIKRTSEGSEQLKQIQALQVECAAELQDIKQSLPAATPRMSAKYRISEEIYAEKQEELKRLRALQKRAEKLTARMEKALNALSESKTDKKIEKSIADDLSGVYSLDIGETAPDESLQKKKREIENTLSNLLLDKNLPDYICAHIRQAMAALQKANQMQYLKNFEAVTVKKITQAAAEYQRDAEQKKTAYLELLDRYALLCREVGENAGQFPYSEAEMAKLRSEIERLEKLLVQRREQEYISDCVDEVMADMGYDLLGTKEVRKKSGKHFRSELFTFREGTAVNVTYSSDGQISMELGGLDREDRIPTPEEAAALTNDMNCFCSEFAEFERRMRAKGVIVGSRIKMSPPTADYASIINVNDYDIDESKQVPAAAGKEKTHKQTEKKTMRRNDDGNG